MNERTYAVSSVDKIVATEANVAKLQVGLAAVQDGLHRAESVARATDLVERRVAGSVKLAFGVLALSALLTLTIIPPLLGFVVGPLEANGARRDKARLTERAAE